MKKGFTLIELLVVTTVLGILMAVGVVSYQSSLKKGRDAKRKADLEQIRSALEMYRADNGNYPAVSGNAETSLTSYLVTAPNNYLTSFPKDPQDTSKGYYYYYDGTATVYNLCAYLDSPDASSPCGSSGACGGTPPVNCNFGLSNP